MEAAEDGVLVGVRLKVAYDGADFVGWASQPRQRTVQGVLTEAVVDMARHDVELRCAGRTDSGVHAEAQIAAFDTTRAHIEPQGWVLGLNQRLPRDVAVRSAERCEAGYVPRFDSFDKTYRYLVFGCEARHPLWRHRAWFMPHVLDVSAMRAAAARLVGTHDFAAFRASDDGRPTTVRTIHRFDVIAGYWDEPYLFAFEVRGTAFLKQMVRILAGTIVDAGRGKRTPESIDALLRPGAKRIDAGPTAPAHGLTLVSITLGRSKLGGAPDVEIPPRVE